MIKKLSLRDQRVIDLLLDHAERPASAQGGSSGYSEPDEAISGRVSMAENLLGLLSLCTAEDPPADLVQRTLSRIDSSFSARPSTRQDRRDQLGPMA